MKEVKRNISELTEFAKQVWKDMPAEFKRTTVLGCSSTAVSIASLAMSGTTKKLAASIGLATCVATWISAIDASKKMIDSINATTPRFNTNWEAYKAANSTIFGNNYGETEHEVG